MTLATIAALPHVLLFNLKMKTEIQNDLENVRKSTLFLAAQSTRYVVCTLL